MFLLLRCIFSASLLKLIYIFLTGYLRVTLEEYLVIWKSASCRGLDQLNKSKYSIYGVICMYSWYSVYILEQSFYSIYGGATAQYPMYSSGLMAGVTGFYPYPTTTTTAASAAATSTGLLGDTAIGSNGGLYTSVHQNFGVQYPHGSHLFHYSALSSTAAGYPQHYAPSMSMAPSPTLHSGNSFSLHLTGAFNMYSHWKIF